MMSPENNPVGPPESFAGREDSESALPGLLFSSCLWPICWTTHSCFAPLTFREGLGFLYLSSGVLSRKGAPGTAVST